MWAHDDSAAMQALGLLRNYAVHELAYRAMVNASPDCSSLHRFWTDALNAHAMTAVNIWCMVFGARGKCGHNPTHWHNWLDRADVRAARKDFLKHLDSGGQINASDFRSLWREMTDFRNKYTAHRQIAPNLPMPSLSEGLQVAIAFENWYHRWSGPKLLSGNSLEEIVFNWRADYEQISKAVLPIVRLPNES